MSPRQTAERRRAATPPTWRQDHPTQLRKSLCPGKTKRKTTARERFAGAVHAKIGAKACGCYTAPVYARKLKVDIVVDGQRRPCPLDWLDSFAMRNFTGSAEFDDTLPTGEGRIEAGYRVDPGRLAEALSAWLTKRGKGDGRPVQVEIQPE